MILRWMAKKRSPKGELSRILDGHELTSFPLVVSRAMRLLRDPDCTLATISTELEKDPGASARLLTLTNSASRGLRRKVSSVDHALALLGRSEVEALLLTLAVGRSVGGAGVVGFDASSFWQASARRAVVARRLARRIDPSSHGETFTASLLQDMAVPVLARARRDRYVAVHAQWRSDGGSLAELERSEFEWDHAYVGATMAESWSFPDTLTESISGHHAGEGPLPAARLVASLGEGSDLHLDELVEEARRSHALPSDDVVAILEEAGEEAAEIGRLFVGP